MQSFGIIALSFLMTIAMTLSFRFVRVGLCKFYLQARPSSSEILERKMEKSLWDTGFRFVIGSDEAGRGKK